MPSPLRGLLCSVCKYYIRAIIYSRGRGQLTEISVRPHGRRNHILNTTLDCPVYSWQFTGWGKQMIVPNLFTILYITQT